MKKVNIKLGSTGPGEVTSPLKGEPSEYFPSLHVSSKEPLELPDKGVMLVKFRKVRSTTDKSSPGQESYSCTFDIKEIVAVTGKADDDEEEIEAPAKNRSKESEDALDALMAEKVEKKSKGY